MSLPSTTVLVLFYLVCASMTTLCLAFPTEQEQIDRYEAMFETFRDEYKETDHYRLVYSAIQLFDSCDCEYPQDRSDVNSKSVHFRSLSFSEQIDLVMHAFVDIHLLPSQLTNPFKDSLMTEADFRTKYQAWPQSFMDNEMATEFNSEDKSNIISDMNCRRLNNFLRDVSFKVHTNQDVYHEMLSRTFKLIYQRFIKWVYNVDVHSPLDVVRRVPSSKVPLRPVSTWKFPRWKTVAKYGLPISLAYAGWMLWPSPRNTTEHVIANFTDLVIAANSTGGGDQDGGLTTLKYRTNGVIIVTIVVILLVVLGAVAFLAYCLYCRSSGKKTKARKTRLSISTSSSLFASTNATTKKSSTGSHVTTPVSH